MEGRGRSRFGPRLALGVGIAVGIVGGFFLAWGTLLLWI